MGVNVTGPLDFVATIDESKFDVSIKSMGDSIEALTLKAANYQQVIDSSLDKKVVEEYKGKLADTQAQIEKLTSAGVDGFSALQDKISDSAAEVEKYKLELAGTLTGDAANGPLVSLPDADVLNEQLANVQAAKAQITEMYEAGTIGADTYNQSIVRLSESETLLFKGIEEFDLAQKGATQTTEQTTIAIEEEIGALENLKGVLTQLKADRLKIQDPLNLGTANPELIKQNQLIQEAEAEVSRLSNVGKSGFDELGNAIVNTNEKQSKFSAAISRATDLQSIGATAVSRLSRQLVGLGVGFLSFAIGAKAVEVLATAFASFFEILKGGESTQQLNIDLAKKANDIYAEQATTVNLLVKEAEDQNTTQLRQKEILDELNTVSPTYFGNLKDIHDIVTKLPDAYAKYNAALQLNSRVEASKSLITEKYKSLLEDQRKLVEVQSKKVGTDYLSQFAESLKDITNVAGSVDLGKNVKAEGLSGILNPSEKGLKSQIENTQRVIDQLSNGIIADQQKIQKNGGDIAGKGIAITQKSAINALEVQKIAVQSDADAQNAIYENHAKSLDERKAALKSSLDDQLNIININQKQQLQNTKLSESDKTVIVAKANAEKLKATDEYYKNVDNLTKSGTGKKDPAVAILASQTTLQQKIQALKDQSSSKDKTRDEQEIDAVKAKYKTIYDEIIAQNTKYNAYLKTHSVTQAAAKGLVYTDPNSLQSNEDDAIKGLQGKQSVEQDRIQLEAQKTLFNQYEDFKLKAGTDTANKLYANELNGFTSYIDLLKSKQPTEDELNSSDPYIKRRASALQDYINKALPAAQAAELDKQKRHLQNLITQDQSWQQQRQALIDNSNADIATLNAQGYTEQAAQAQTNLNDQLTQLDVSLFERQDSYKNLFNNIDRVSTESAKTQINNLYTQAAAAVATGKISVDAYALVILSLDKLKTATDNRVSDDIIKIGDAFGKVGSALSGINSGLGSMVSEAGSAVQSIGNIKKEMDVLADSSSTSEQKFDAQLGTIIAAATAVVDIIGSITSAAAQRKKAEEDYYNATIKSQNDYNVALNEELRLKYQLSSNVFTTDYKAQILDASEALVDANAKLATSLIALQNGVAKVGQRNAVDLGATVKDTLAGAVAGFAIGGPIGAGVGAVVGLIGGLFGSKKKKDTYGDLLTQFPELILKAADGTTKFNEALAKNLIANNLVDDTTKTLLQNTIDLNDARQAAIDQINSSISTLAGSLGDDLRSSLVDAFEAGTDAAKAFGDSVSKVIENIISQFLFEAVFQPELDKLQTNLKNSLGVAGDGDVAGDLEKFYADAVPLTKEFDDGLAAANKAAAAAGLTVFGPTDTTDPNSTSTLESGIKGITTDQADLIAGQFGGQRLATLEGNRIATQNGLTLIQLSNIAMSKLEVLNKIEANTAITAINSDYLSLLKDVNISLKSIDKKAGSTAGTMAANGLPI